MKDMDHETQQAYRLVRPYAVRAVIKEIKEIHEYPHCDDLKHVLETKREELVQAIKLIEIDNGNEALIGVSVETEPYKPPKVSTLFGNPAL